MKGAALEFLEIGASAFHRFLSLAADAAALTLRLAQSQ
jgi:hypothetical protein